MTKRKKGNLVDGGRMYRRGPGGLVPEPDASAGVVDVWVCRRVADFPFKLAPAGAATSRCADCGEEIAYNPRRILTVPPSTPQICMQCAQIEPLPIEKPFES
jgi:hypothetical protein